MNIAIIRMTFAVALVLALTAAGLWAAGADEEPAAAAEKEMVLDPTTGKMVTAPEYGGTMTVWGGAWVTESSSDPYFSYSDATVGVVEKLGISDWGIDRDEFDLKTVFLPDSYLTGRLAESWDISPDGLTYTFNIREGVNWHNKAPMNGRALTAEDVVYNFHRQLGLGNFTDAGPNPNWPARNLKGIPFESITATDDSTVVMKLKEPSLPALNIILLDLPTYIMPPEVIEQHGDVLDWRNLVGTGPFMLTDVVDGSSATRTKNPDYWGYDPKYPQNRLPYVDELKVVVILEESSIFAALRSGKLDMRWRALSLDSVESLRQTNPEIVAHPIWFRSSDSFAPDVRVPPFNDINVRRAMQLALDNETAAASYWKGQANATPQGLVGVKGYYIPFEQWDQEVKQYYRYDPEAAEKLLDEAGYPRGADGTRFQTVLNTAAFASLDFAEIAAAYWAEIGVDVKIDVLIAPEFAQRMRPPSDLEGMSGATAGSTDNPVTVFDDFHSDSEVNRGGVQDPEYDAMVDAALGATSIEEQKRLIAEVDMYAIEKHWHIFGPKSPVYILAQPWVKGYNGELSVNKWEDWLIFANLWIDSEMKEAMGY